MMSQILNQEAPRARVGVLSGPNLALEIAKKDLAGTVIASPRRRCERDSQECTEVQVFQSLRQ